MTPAQLERLRSRTLADFLKTVKVIVDEFDRRSDPGTSDLDREQPFHITVPLGTLRDLRFAYHVLKEGNQT